MLKGVNHLSSLPLRQKCLSRTTPVCFAGSQQAPKPAQPVYYPGIEEEYEVSHDAFHRAFEEAKPERAQVPGLQEFAAAIYERRRLIPSQHDPLMQIFDEFDENNDGVLHSPEIASALRSRGVAITTEQVQWLIDTFEQDKTCPLPSFCSSIVRQEWPSFVYSLTVADMHAKENRTKSLESAFD